MYLIPSEVFSRSLSLQYSSIREIRVESALKAIGHVLGIRLSCLMLRVILILRQLHQETLFLQTAENFLCLMRISTAQGGVGNNVVKPGTAEPPCVAPMGYADSGTVHFVKDCVSINLHCFYLLNSGSGCVRCFCWVRKFCFYKVPIFIDCRTSSLILGNIVLGTTKRRREGGDFSWLRKRPKRPIK